MRRYLTAAIVGVIVLGLAPQAGGVLFTFDGPADLEEWEVRTNWPDALPAQWEVDDGVLKVSAPTAFLTLGAVRGLERRQGSVSFRFRFVEVPKEVLQVGVVFRLQPDPDPTGYPGQYVTLSAGSGWIVWNCTRQWDPEPGGFRLGTGWGVPLNGWDLDRWNVEDWMRIRIDFHWVGWHEVYVDTGGGLERVMGREEVLNALVPTRHNRMKVGEALDLSPAKEMIAAGDSLFEEGTVGLYIHGNHGAVPQWLEFDDFAVSDWLAVPDESSLVTTWAQLKRE